MAGTRFFDNVPAGGYISSESEGEWCVDHYYGGEAVQAEVVHPTPAVINGEDVMIWEDQENKPVAGTPGDEGASLINPWNPRINSHGRARSLEPRPRRLQLNTRGSSPFTSGRSRSLDATRGVNDVVVDQPSPVVQLVAEDDQMIEIPANDSGYETMNMEDKQDKAETRDVGTDTAMDVCGTSDEAMTSGGGLASIRIYCVCCSKQVENSDNLKNRLCKDCVDMMAEEVGNEEVLNNISNVCAVCAKSFEKSESQPQQICKECICIMVSDYDKETGGALFNLECDGCHRLFRQKYDKLHETLCPLCHPVTRTPASQNPPRVCRSRQRQDKPGWIDTLALQGYTAVVVKAQLLNYFYTWCDGHRVGNEAQEAHQCLDEFYALDAVRKVCYNISPHMLVKMIHSMQMADGVRLGKGAVTIVSRSLWDIYTADDPFLKIKQFRRGCPVCVRTRVEKIVERWGSRLCPVRYRGQFGSLCRKLAYSGSP